MQLRHGRARAVPDQRQSRNAPITYVPADALPTLTDRRNLTIAWNHDQYGRVTNKTDALGTERAQPLVLTQQAIPPAVRCYGEEITGGIGGPFIAC